MKITPVHYLIGFIALAVMYSKRSFMLYGLWSDKELRAKIKRVCDVLGHSSGYAPHLIYETIGAETNFGKTPDLSPTGAGHGIAQHDEFPFEDMKRRIPQSIKDIVKHEFGVITDSVSVQELNYSVFLSVLFTRIKYKMTPGAVPETIEGRAAYWKKWYNSTLGKGTPEHYLKSNQKRPYELV